jgi:hypothetical protein
MMPPEEEKERAMAYMESVTCPEWRNGFLDTLCPGVRLMGCRMFVRRKTSYYGVLF